MNNQLISIISAMLGLIVGFTLGQFFNLDLKPWGKVAVPTVRRRKRTRKLPWHKVVGMFMLVAIFYTVVSNSMFQNEQARCNEENCINSAQRSVAIQEDNALSIQDRANLGVMVRAIVQSPQPTSPPIISDAVEDMNSYIAQRNPTTQQERTEAALDWYQVEQQKIIAAFLRNQEVREQNPTITQCRID